MGSDDRGPGDDSEGGAETDHLAERLQNALSREGSPSQNAEAGATRTTSDDLLLGRLALESGLITPEQLGEAIAHQNNAKAPDGGITLGQYFLREKWISPEALARLLAEDAHRAQQVPDLPRYEIRSLVGQGATALVYSAWDRDLRRLVALKLLRETTALGETARARFRREAQVAAGLSHPNVIAVHDAGEVNGQLYLVMELVEGRPLGEVLRDPGVDRSKKLSLLEQVAQGVAAAHGRGIIHRDLKPANILVTAQGLPKVGDFGLAHLVDSSTELTKTGATLGTPLYMSPEQVEGRSEDLSPATDVYALGAILYEIVAGRPPHTGETTMEIYRKIVHDEPLAPSKIDPGLPADLETIILKAIDKDHRRRYGTAEAFAGDLGRHLRGEPIQGKRLPWGALLLRRARRHKGALIAGIALTTLALAAVGALSSSARKKHRIESAIARALLFEREARYLEASTLLRSTLEEDPLNEQARTSLGRVVDLERRDQKLREDRDRREKKAAAILEAVRPALGEAEHYSYDPKATSEGLGQRLGALRTRIREAMEMAPSLPLTHYLLGHSFEIAEEDEPAEESTLQALKIDPEFSAARYQLGRIYLGRALKRMIGTTPEEIELKKGEARELAERAAGEIEKALTRETAFEDNLHRELARTTLAYLTGPRLRALELAERGFKQFPQKDGREEFLWIAGLASSGGDQIRFFDQALEIRPKWTIVHLARAGAKLAAGEADAALRDCEAILQIRPGDLDATLNRAVALSLKGDPAAALAGFDRVIAARPGDAVALYNRALLRRQKGDLGGALEDLTQTLRLHPAFAPAFNNRGSIRLLQNELPSAVSDFDSALRQKPEFAEALNNRASALFRQGELGGALRDLGEALRLSPGFAEAYYNRSLIRLKEEAREAALEDLGRAVASRPSWNAPYVLRAQVRSLTGDTLGARQDARRALDLGVSPEDRRALEALHLGDE